MSGPEAREARAVIEQLRDDVQALRVRLGRHHHHESDEQRNQRIDDETLLTRALALLADVLGSQTPVKEEKGGDLAARVDEQTVIPPERATASENQTTPARFRKKPVVIEAEQFFSDRPLPFADRCVLLYGTHRDSASARWHVETLEGPLNVSEGDWIIKGIKGEFYPCKPDIFAATYEPASAEVVSQPPQEES